MSSFEFTKNDTQFELSIGSCLMARERFSITIELNGMLIEFPFLNVKNLAIVLDGLS